MRAAVIGLGGLLVAGGTFLSVSMFDLDLRLPTTALALPVLLSVGGAATLTAASRRDWRVPSTPVVLLVTLVGVYAFAVAIHARACSADRGRRANVEAAQPHRQ